MKYIYLTIQIIFGITLILARRWLAEKNVANQNKRWGLKLDESDIKTNEVLSVIVGVLVLVAAALVITGVISYK